MDKKLQKFLEANKVPCKIMQHRTVYTAFTEAETQHKDPKTVVKTVLVLLSKPSLHVTGTDKKTGRPVCQKIDSLLVAVPARHRVDFKKVAKTVNDHAKKSHAQLVRQDPKIKKPAVVTAKMAREKDIIKKLKTKVGLLHPFGALFGIPLLLDKKLGKNKKVIVPAGSYTESLEINYSHLLKVTPGMEGSFTE